MICFGFQVRQGNAGEEDATENLVSVIYKKDIYRAPKLALEQKKCNLLHYFSFVFLDVINCCFKIFVKRIIILFEARRGPGLVFVP